MKLETPREIIEVDYNKYKTLLSNNQFKDNDGNHLQYSIEYRNGTLHIVELNFKPNTKSSMSIPIPVYNEFCNELSKIIPTNGIKGNEVMGLFISIYESYRRKYGKNIPLKLSSYTRYASVLNCFWNTTKGELGFKVKQLNSKSIYIINDELIDIKTYTHGYYILPTKYNIVTFIDKNQSNLLQWR